MGTIGYINVSLETFGGLLSLIFIFSLRVVRKNRDRTERLYIRLLVGNTILLFCDAAAWLFKGRPDPLSFYIVRISNFLVYSFGYIMLVLFTHYLVSYLGELQAPVTKKPVRFMFWFMLLGVAFVVVSQFNQMYYIIDENNIYHRQNWFWLSQVFGIVGMLINASLLVRCRKWLKQKEKIAFGVYIFLPVMALLFQILFYNIAVLYLSTTICLLCVYIGIQSELSQEISRKELELEKSRTAIMLSQIQPHFLYNALLAIKELCESEPKKACDALEHFSYYLRGNLDSLSFSQLIPFQKELQHVRDYLYLEKMRFEDRVKIQWDIRCMDFMLPPLTLQPIVENAVRYGITKKNGGGTLEIRSERFEAAVVITVRDDGLGFDVNAPYEDGRTHIGIKNVRNRLDILCGGSLLIKSSLGTGTEAQIILPQREVMVDENDCGGRRTAGAR